MTQKFQNPLELIKNSKQNAEWALKVQMEEIINKFNSIENNYIRERKNDIYQVCKTLIKYLTGHESKQLSSDKNRISLHMIFLLQMLLNLKIARILRLLQILEEPHRILLFWLKVSIYPRWLEHKTLKSYFKW